MLPEPICTQINAPPLVLTPLNINVILFTVDGKPVKSIEVPLVVATAVPIVIGVIQIGDALEPDDARTWPLVP